MPSVAVLAAVAVAVAVAVAGCAEANSDPAAQASTSPLPAAPVVTLAVGVGPTAPPSPGPTKTQANRGVQVDARDLDGSWEGEYVCTQGPTGLRLTIDGVSETAVEATFDFFPLATNPDVPSGSYAMAGTLSAADGLVLDGVRWLVQPNGYVMVGLRADEVGSIGVGGGGVGGGVAELRGTVTGPNCSTFVVRRVP